MPIIVPNTENKLFSRLKESGAVVISEDTASEQITEPARIGILNLMPGKSMEKTETHWLRAISQTVLQIEPVFIKFDDDPREDEDREDFSRDEVLARYIPFSTVASQGLHGLIVTGDNLELRRDNPTARELLPFEEIPYFEHLGEVIDWARLNVRNTIYSCLAAHFALKHLYGLDRKLMPSKVFGVYEHKITDVNSEFTRGTNNTIIAPHSHWGNISPQAVGSTGAQLLAISERVGWLLAQDSNNYRDNPGKDLFIQGHPEYGKCSLQREYVRDLQHDPKAPIPENYYPNDDSSEEPDLTWATDAAKLYSNWITDMYGYFSKPNSPLST